MRFVIFIGLLIITISCKESNSVINENQLQTSKEVTAKEILANPDYLAISYGGYRANSRDVQPDIAELKEDLSLLSAMNIKILRTYNTKLKHAANVLEAIHQLKESDADFEMYVMLGTWIDCENAWTPNPNHNREDVSANTAEIRRAVDLANRYPDIVKIIAVGNEAMVKWATSYFVQPVVILKWVKYLQDLKSASKLPSDIWITSSDNFASWGGGDSSYHTKDLKKLIAAVDYVSLHTYPMHDTHYNPDFWGVLESEEMLTLEEKVTAAMERATNYAIAQFESTKEYIQSLDLTKPIHIGETGWASYSNGYYGIEGSRATDEYKQALYFRKIKAWAKQEGVSCFYFEAFDEIWKDAKNPSGSENHFGLFTVEGKAKYALWDWVDKGIFNGLGRDGEPVQKTYQGNKFALLQEVHAPDFKTSLSGVK